MSPHTGLTTSDATRTVRVSFNARGPWDVTRAGTGKHTTTCETLGDAQRVGYHLAKLTSPCELIVCDAYHRVVRREVVRHHADGRPSHDRVHAGDH
jgi:hypothetical protein